MSVANLDGPIDSNVWYAWSETRVNWTSSLQFNNNALFFSNNNSITSHWQFFKLKNGNYNIRNRNIERKRQLATCFSATELAISKTQACIQQASDDPSQEWTIDRSWPDKTYRFQNVGNGTKYNLDVHRGTPLFLSDDLSAESDNPAQRWLMTSRAKINDNAYSTAFASAARTSGGTSSPAGATATATGSSSSASTSLASSSNSNAASSSSSGLSTGAAAGIGAGVAVLIIALIAAAIFVLLRRRKNKKQQQVYGAVPNNDGNTGNGIATTAPVGHDQKKTVGAEMSAGQDRAVYEAPGHEVRAPPGPAEMPANEIYNPYNTSAAPDGNGGVLGDEARRSIDKR
ncbi:hypothetical protein EJ08DRAFT_656821 [Tothia fuscella]|uniref:Ricin B lectin domain-containing protein n=1 Tax=Tothia fuscella TaxID=1048955 RepID=A0A9P4P0S9_9PEZI|nr:hypothetical protein EJ08DRAFT_656821 [Tothia fuscella]